MTTERDSRFVDDWWRVMNDWVEDKGWIVAVAVVVVQGLYMVDLGVELAVIFVDGSRQLVVCVYENVRPTSCG